MEIESASIPAEAYQAMFDIAEERLSALGGGMIKYFKRRAEIARIRQEAAIWPLSRCVAILPYFPANHGLLNDGALAIDLAVFWFAPFPATHLTVDLVATFPDLPITYTVTDLNVTAKGSLPDAVDRFHAGMRLGSIRCTPDRPLGDLNLGPATDPSNGFSAMQTQFCRRLLLTQIRVTAHGPWERNSRDSEMLPDIEIQVPRFAG